MRARVLSKLTALGLILCWISLHPAAVAQTLYVDTLLNGTAPTNSGPWLSITFTNLFPGKVSIMLESMLDSPQFISEISLNLNPGLEGAQLEFAQTAGPTASSITLAAEDNGADIPGGGTAGKGFDILIEWQSGKNGDRFDLSDVAIITVSGPEELDAEDFFFGNTVDGSDGKVMVAAHVQGIPNSDGTTISGVVGLLVPSSVPEPSSLGLFCLAAASIWWWRRRVHRRSSQAR